MGAITTRGLKLALGRECSKLMYSVEESLQGCLAYCIKVAGSAGHGEASPLAPNPSLPHCS